jgi:hypothetical protein
VDVWVVIVLIVAALALLAVGGAIAQRRRLEASRERFTRHLDQVNNQLAAAHASDKGWDPERLHAAAQHALAEHGGARAGGDLTLVAVIDRPGTEDDKAVFETDGGSRLTLGRRGDDWVFETMQ